MPFTVHVSHNPLETRLKKEMNRDQEPPSPRDAEDQGHRPSWLTHVWKITHTSNRTKVVAAVVAVVALGMARLSYLQDQTHQTSATPIIPVQTQFAAETTAPHTDIADETVAAEMVTIGIDEIPAQPVIDTEPPPPSLNAEDPEQDPPGWIFVLLGFALAVIGGTKAAKWTEDNGYDMKRFEDWANRKSKKPKGKDDPAP